MTAVQAAEAIALGIKEVMPEAEVLSLPVGDGGEGTADAIVAALSGKGQAEIKKICCKTLDPLRRDISTHYHLIHGTTALIESAAASGLNLLRREERDVMRADSYGTGLLIADAFKKGVRDFLICMGGTATCDGGYGAYCAMQEAKVEGATFTLLCDVRNPLCGPDGAAAVFGPQKGATPEIIRLLEERLKECAARYMARFAADASDMEYAGAAGGLAGMLMSCYGARPLSGIGKVLSLYDFADMLKNVSLVITGEGCADATTLSGKAPAGVLYEAKKAGIPVALVAGRVVGKEALLREGFEYVAGATPSNPDPGVAPEKYLAGAVANLLRQIIPTQKKQRPS